MNKYSSFLFIIYITPILDAFKFLMHPMDVHTKPGLSVNFSIKTSQSAKTRKWYFQEEQISSEATDYGGSTTDSLVIARCLPKHKGVYRCVVTDASGKTHTSDNATLTIGEPTKLYSKTSIPMSFVCTMNL